MSTDERPVETGTVLARIDGDRIGVEDLVGVGPLGNERARRDAVEAVVTRRLAASEARRRGLADSPETRAEIAAIQAAARARREALLRDTLYRALRDALDPSEADLRTHYEATQNRYLERRLELRRQIFPSRDEAEAVDTALGSDGRLHPGRSEAVGPAPVAKLPRGVLPEALRLRAPGDRTLVETDIGWALIELVEIHLAEVQSFEEVGDRVEESWRALRGQEAFQALIAEERERVEISIHEEAISDESIWPGPSQRK